MRLKSLEIYGFKSFADKTEITFDKGITGIVGPNGSGKSNIADAVRWALGEQSVKALRGGRMQDVIFGGTQKRKPMPYCEVSLIFDNEDGMLKSPYTEVMVTRRAYRNGEGEYYLNKTSCRLKDIIELFRDTGIGREGYSIIGQGRIDDILSAKSEERRSVFEEAAGIMTYRTRKEEAERNLDKTRDNLSRVNDIIDEIGSRLDPLKEQADSAKKYLSLSERLKKLDLNIFLVRHDKLKERIENLKENVNSQQTLFNETAKQIDLVQEKRAKAEEEQENLELEYAAARRLEDELTQEQALSQQALERQRAKVETVEVEQIRLEELIQENKERLKALLSLSQDGEKGEQFANERKEKHLKDYQDAQSDFEAFQAKVAEAEESLEEKKQALIDAMNRLSDAKSRETRQQTMLVQMTKRLKEMQGILERRKEEEKIAALASEQAKATLMLSKEELNRLEKRLLEFKNEEADRQAAIRSLSDKISQSASKLQGDSSRLNLLKEMSEGYEGYYGAVRKALAYSKNNPKVCGVVARLMKVPKELETAIDMALGGTLQHIVVEDEETAKQVIDYLRQNKLGRTTFLPLTTIKGRSLNHNEKQALSMPGCVGLASEHVECEPKYQSIIDNILGRTVIAENLDAAIAMMRKGNQSFNTVTLAGDVMRAGGAMTGGTSQNQAVSLLSREREMQELQKQVEKGKAALAALQDELENLLHLQSLEQEKIDEAAHLVSEQEIAVARDSERKNHAEQHFFDSQKALIEVEEADRELKESIKDIQRDLQDASGKSHGVRVDQAAMEKDIVACQSALFTMRAELEEKRTQSQRMALEYQRLSNDLDNLVRDRKRRLEEKSGLESKIAQQQAKGFEIIDHLQKEKERVDELFLAKEQASELQKQAREASVKVENARQKTRKQLSDIAKEIDSLHVVSNDYAIKQHRAELTLARTEDELQNLINHVWNTYELTYANAEPFRQEESFNLPQAEREAKDIKGEIRLLGAINVNAVEEYTQQKERHDMLVTQRDDAIKAEEDLVSLIQRLLGTMETQFLSEFNKINEFFGETFARLFGGGQAELRLIDPQDPLGCGIEIVAQPPGKKLQLLSLLSGGERALTAIAILFAILKLKPSPFCLLDEIEAALDDANIGYFADYLCEYARTTQFIVVTHRKGTMERCDALYGVAMQEKGVSSMVSVNLENYPQ